MYGCQFGITWDWGGRNALLNLNLPRFCNQMKPYLHFEYNLKLYNWSQMLEGGIIKGSQIQVTKHGWISSLSSTKVMLCKKTIRESCFLNEVSCVSMFKSQCYQIISWVIKCWIDSFFVYIFSNNLAHCWFFNWIQFAWNSPFSILISTRYLLPYFS